MKSFFLAILAASISLSSSLAFGELPEFLVAVTGSDEAIAQAKNDYFLKKNTYFARRYRIVQVNVGLLESVERFRISLFDDESITVEVARLKIMHDGLSIRWKGRITEPTLSVENLITGGITPEDAKIAHSAIVGLRIVAAEVSYDEATGRKYSYYFPKFESFRYSNSRNTSGGNASEPEKSALYDVIFTIEALLPYQYWLRPLETDPRYHVLIEIDPNKEFSIGPLDDPENPEQGAKRRQYRDFIRSLGPDPRPSDLHLD